MGTAKKGNGTQRSKKKITRKDIHAAESVPALIKKLVKRVVDGDAETKEIAAAGLMQIAQIDHGKHSEDLHRAKATKPLVALLRGGGANAQTHAAAALAGMAVGKPDHQRAI